MHDVRHGVHCTGCTPIPLEVRGAEHAGGDALDRLHRLRRPDRPVGRDVEDPHTGDGTRVPAQVRQGAAALLGVGAGRQFVTMGGVNGAVQGTPNIAHGCFTMEGFHPDRVLKALADYGIKPRSRADGPPSPLTSYVTMRMEDRGGAKGGTPELYFTDPDGILMQIQDVSYCGGSGYLGEVCA